MKRKLTVLLALTATACLASTSNSWTWLNPKPAGPWLLDVTFVDGRFIAGGGDGNIAVSTNGLDWASTRMMLPAISIVDGPVPVWAVSRIVHARDKYLACVAAGTTAAVSSNGLDWTGIPNICMKELVAGEDRFVGFCPDGWINVSSNGLEWMTASAAGVWPTAIAAGARRFVIVGNNGGVAVSRDGMTWKKTSSGTTSNLVSVAFHRGVFLAAAEDGQLFRSVFGHRWHRAGRVPFSSPRIFTGGRGFYVYQEAGWLKSQVWHVARNGAIRKSTMPDGVTSAVRAGGLTVGVGPTVATSRDERHWTVRSSGIEGWTVAFMDIVIGSNVAVAVTSDTSGGYFPDAGLIVVMTNGTDWIVAHDHKTNLNSVAYGLGRFVAVGKHGSMLTSTNGLSWQQVPLASTSALVRVRFAGDRFFALGGGGTTLQSIDGLNWSGANSPAGNWSDAVFGNGVFVLTAGTGIRVSTNAQDWTTPIPWGGLDTMIFADGVFVGAWGPYVYTSLDVTNWSAALRGFDRLRTVAVVPGGVMASGDNGTTAFSSDGLIWDWAPSVPIYSVYSLASDGNSIYAVGTSASIIRKTKAD